MKLRLRSEAALADTQLLSLLPSQQPSTSSLTSVPSEDDTLRMLKMSSSPLTSIHSFENYCGIAALLPPFREDVFASELVKELELLYKQLYPHRVVGRVSPFYVRSGRAALWNQVIGSVMNATSCNSSSVITAYWPSRGNDLSKTDDSRMRVGRVQYFCKHRASFCDSDTSEHIFAYVAWKQKHPHEEWLGISATVCLNMDEAPSMCSFIPVQRIHAVCAHCVLDVDIHGLKENVFIAVPVPMKLSL